MRWGNLLLGTVLLYLASFSAIAQPTCFTDYGLDSYCEHTYGSIIAAGRVTSLEPASEYSLLKYKAAEITAHYFLKGNAGTKLRISLPAHCAGSIEKGGVYIFNIEPAPQKPNVLTARHWARIDQLSDSEIGRLLDGMESLLAGKHQPVLAGSVSRPDGSPFVGITVVTRNGQKPAAATTDADGRFEFESLPAGDYKVSVQYPPGYGPSDYYDKARETDERDFSPSNWRCSTRMSFSTALSAKITGTMEMPAAKSQLNAFFQLVDASKPLTDDSSGNIRADSFSYPVEEADVPSTAFKFHHLPTGRYVLKISFHHPGNALTTFYYPGVRSIKDAKTIEVGLGTSQVLNFSIPISSLITVSGRVQLPGGTPIFGGVSLVDAEKGSISDSFSPADRDRDDIKFIFTAAGGRPVYLCAGFDGVKNGRQIRMYSKLPLSAATNHEDLLITLDKPIPTGVFWWDQCRKDS